MRILKDSSLDPRDKSSLRPISLLDVLGKWLEDLMVSHLAVELERTSWLDARQYGFVPGTGTEDAVNRLIDGVGESATKYVLGIFLGISGAFDGARSSQILDEVEAVCSDRYLVCLFRDYFSGRMAQMTVNWRSY